MVIITEIYQDENNTLTEQQIMEGMMEQWSLHSIQGSTPKVRKHLEMFYMIQCSGNYTYGSLIEARQWHSKRLCNALHREVKRVSKDHPRDVITVDYAFGYCIEKPGKICTIEYKNGSDRLVGVKPMSPDDELLKWRPIKYP